MSTRMTQSVVRRPNLPLTAKDEADLAALRNTPGFRKALHDLAASRPAVDGELGESVLLHAVFEAGLATLQQSALEEGYRQLAEQYAAAAGQRRRTSRRRLPEWSEDE